MEETSKGNTYLIITASGGSGILQAAKAQVQRIKKQNPNAKIIVKDIMLEWLGGLIGNFGVNAWNKAQKKGNVRYQELLVSFQRIADFIFWPQIFFLAFRTLIKEDIDFVIDAQPLGTSALTKAIRIFNKISKKKLTLRKIFVDLPSTKSTHYFNNIKRLSKKDKKLVFISTVEPVLENDQTDEDFWKKHCKISLDKVCYNSYPIRMGFDSYTNKERLPIDHFINICFENQRDAHYIQKIIEKSEEEVKKQDSYFEIKIGPDDFLITILLGSQPAFNGTQDYVINLLRFLLDNNHIQKNIYIVPYCSASKDGLIKKLHDKIMDFDKYPKNLRVIPMTFQPEDVIASLYFRSDLTITRSGGQTAVELMKVSKAKICVHTECKYNKRKPISEKKLLRGIPCWESGSASYMKDKMDASIINPDSFIDLFSDLVS